MFFITKRRATISTRTDTLLPYTPLSRSGQREAGESGHEHAAAAEDVAEPAAGDQHHCIGQAIGGDDELQFGEAGLQRVAHVGDGDVDDEDVEHRHEGACQHHGKAGPGAPGVAGGVCGHRSEEHTSELQSLMHISYAVFCLKKKRILRLTNYTPSYG